MNIRYAVMGLLRNASLSGYDMKKAIIKSPFIYWSGNNNQIYKALAELEDEGFVEMQTVGGIGSPAKKVYTLTKSGADELRRTSLEFPEIPEVRKTFLMQLFFGGSLAKSEVTLLLDQYSREVKGASIAASSGNAPETATPYEAAAYALIIENIRQTYEMELEWIEKFRKIALPLLAESHEIKSKGSEKNVEYIVTDKNGKRYIRITAGEIGGEADALDLVAACVENGVNGLIIPSEFLSDEFFRLSTGVAGQITQKLVNYNIRAAIVMDAEKIRGKFGDFIIEANRGASLRSFKAEQEAEKWLIGGDLR